jgi:uncharacterized protein involved in high-affinity Fe2+ transport
LKPTKGEIMINKVKKLFVLLLVAAVVSLGLTGCKEKSELPTGEHPVEEIEVEEIEVEEVPAEEHPAGEHPAGEHPQ